MSSNHMGIKFKELRRKRGLTQFDVARQLGRPESVISKFETGRIVFNQDELNRLSEILKETRKGGINALA